MRGPRVAVELGGLGEAHAATRQIIGDLLPGEGVAVRRLLSRVRRRGGGGSGSCEKGECTAQGGAEHRAHSQNLQGGLLRSYTGVLRYSSRLYVQNCETLG